MTDPRQTLAALVEGLRERSDATALVAFTGEGRRELTYGALHDEARRLALSLLHHAEGRTGPVALMGPNGIDWVVARFALVLANLPCVPIDHDAAPGRIADLVTDSGAWMLIADPERRAAIDEAMTACPHPPELRLLRQPRQDEPGGALFTELEDRPGGGLPRPALDDIVSRFYTSGTTGTPKAVPLSHRRVMTNVEVLLELDVATAGDHVMLPLPLHHSYPFIVGLLLPLAAGATVVFPAGVTGPPIAQAMREGRASVVVGVPRLYRSLLEAIEGRLAALPLPARLLMAGLRRFSLAARRRLGLRLGRFLFAGLHRRLAPELRVLACGGARLDPAVGWKLEALGYEVLTGYGLVETTSIATFNPPGKARIGTEGRPSRACALRIVPVEGMDDGEVQLRGTIVFDGYADNPEANAEAFTEDGWFRTGDLGRQDADGYLHIVGRVKEMIVMPGGTNVAPEDVEAVYARSPLIEEIAVLEKDDRLVAVVVPDMAAAHAGSLRDNLRVAIAELGAELPRYARVSDFVVSRASLPRNQLGKYKRHELPAIHERGDRGGSDWSAVPIAAEDEALLARPRVAALLDLLAERQPEAPLHPDASLQMDLGLDSLSWVELSLAIAGRAGVELAEDAIAEAQTLRDLARAVEEAPESDGGGGAGGASPPERQAGRWLAPRPAVGRLGAVLLYAPVWLFTLLMFRPEALGREKVPARGPLLVAANHVSDIDALLLAHALPFGIRRRIWWGADARRVFGSGAGRLLARMVRLFPVDDRRPSEALDAGATLLERGEVLAWFPEEWRSPTGELQDFRPGIGRLIAEAEPVVLPALIEGTFEAMPRNARLPRPHKVRVRFGDPIPARELLEGGGGNEAIAARLHDRVAALRDAVVNET